MPPKRDFWAYFIKVCLFERREYIHLIKCLFSIRLIDCDNHSISANGDVWDQTYSHTNKGILCKYRVTIQSIHEDLGLFLYDDLMWSLCAALGRGLFSRAWLGCKRWARLGSVGLGHGTHIVWALTASEHGTSDTCGLIAWTIDLLSNIMWEGRLLQHSKQLKIINHKVSKTMHFPELSQSTSQPPSPAIRNVRFPTYEVVMSSLHSNYLLNE